jgi:hypothetical protein
MKTVIDAVNELKGDLNNLKLGLHPKHKIIIDMTKSLYGGLVGSLSASGYKFKEVCTIEDFNQTIAEMSAGIY